MADYIDIVFNGPPGRESGRFVEVEDATGKSISFGEWVQRDDGYWALRLPDPGGRAAIVEECALEADIVLKANFMARGAHLVDIVVPRIRALASEPESDEVV